MNYNRLAIQLPIASV